MFLSPRWKRVPGYRAFKRTSNACVGDEDVRRLAFEETFTTCTIVVCIPTFPRSRETNRSRSDCHPSSTLPVATVQLSRANAARKSTLSSRDRQSYRNVSRRQTAARHGQARRTKVFSDNYAKSLLFSAANVAETLPGK